MPTNIITICFISAAFLLTSCSPTILDLANDKLRTADYSAAADLYEEYLKEQPESLIPRRKLGYALLKTGNAAAAVDRFEKVLDEFPGDSFSTLYLGLSYLQLGKRDKVLTTWAGYRAAQSSRVAVEIKQQSRLIAASGPELSAEIIGKVDSAITAAVDADRARNAYNLQRLGDCG
jgi:tetratricopeptide (TPR) repeat protein